MNIAPRAIMLAKENIRPWRILVIRISRSSDFVSFENVGSSGIIKALESKVGNYEWVIGIDGDTMRDTLMTFITEDALKTLVKWNQEALDLKSVYKEELIYQELPESFISPQIPIINAESIRG